MAQILPFLLKAAMLFLIPPPLTPLAAIPINTLGLTLTPLHVVSIL
jgi:hypothetical protein